MKGVLVKLSKTDNYLLDNQCVSMLSEVIAQIKEKACGGEASVPYWESGTFPLFAKYAQKDKQPACQKF
jgi:hypothetical protein